MLYIIRHGQTDLNKARVLQGRSDAPLNEDGIRQAQEARELFLRYGISFDRIYSSPLIRAVTTAGIIEPNLTPVTDDRLLEMDYGPYEGMDLRNPAPEVMTFFSDFVNQPAPEGMEPLSEVVARLGDFLEEIKEEVQHKNVLTATHAIAMKGALEYLTPESQGSYWSKHIRNCAVYQAEVREDGSWSVPVEVK